MELTAPDGDVWTWGPEDAAQRVTGPALDFCLLVTQRAPPRRPRPARPTGADADRWLDIAQAFAGPPGEGRPPQGTAATTLRIGNASGFYGDRFGACARCSTGGPLDVLTGDYLAELTMLILGRDRLKDPAARLRQDLPARSWRSASASPPSGACRSSPTRAGSTRPDWPTRCGTLADRLGLPVRVAHVEGDDLLPRAADLGLGGPLTANAYLGAFGHRRLPARRRRRRRHRPGHRRLAGRRARPPRTSAGAATTSTRSPAPSSPGTCSSAARRPPAATTPSSTSTRWSGCCTPASRSPSSHADGSRVITKHPGTGGVVDRRHRHRPAALRDRRRRGTPAPTSPPASTRSGSTDDGPDRVRISGVRGEPPPPTSRSASTRSAASATRSPSC